MAEKLSILDLLIERRAHLDEEAAPLRERLVELETEIRQIDGALAGFRRGASPLAGETIMEQAFRELCAAPQGLHVMDLLTRMREERPNLARESLSPQLSRLVKDGKVKREGRLWQANPTAARATLITALKKERP